MDYFNYRNGSLHAEDVPVEQIAAEAGTPCYVYSEATLRRHYELVRDAFDAVDPLICYSVKANSSLAIMKLLNGLGSGFDIVSGGELFRALRIGADPQKIVYAGVGKTSGEIEYALKSNILAFNVESANELAAINRIAGKLGSKAGIALRLNPDVDPKTHRHTTTGKKENKFGIILDTAEDIVNNSDRYENIELIGLDTHLGSPINSVEPYVAALRKVLPFIDKARAVGHDIRYLDIGGGFGIEYRGGETATPADYAEAIIPLVKDSGCRLILEPGRLIAGNAGILLTRVLYVKESGAKRFAICDAAMNDLIRPALYDAFHKIWPVQTARPLSECLSAQPGNGFMQVDIVGPVCESGDFFAKDRVIPDIAEGDLLAVFSAGAYGMTMSSNYNSRPRAPEVIASGSEFRITRKRETYQDLIDTECDC